MNWTLLICAILIIGGALVSISAPALSSRISREEETKEREESRHEKREASGGTDQQKEE